MFTEAAKTAKDYEGVWALIQAIMTIIALYFAVFSPRRKERKDDLRRVTGYRNVAFFAHRVMSLILKERLEGKYSPEHDVIFERCALALEELDLSSIKPAFLIERLVDLQVQNDQVRAIIKARADPDAPRHLSDPEFFKKIQGYADDALGKLNKYVETHKGSVWSPWSDN